MASNDAFLFSQTDLVPCSYTMFYDMKKKGELSDVCIRIDNKVISAHRIILAAAVPYFRTMFTCNLAESRQKEVAMKGLDPAALECLIDFAYTSKVEITPENVQSLLVASEYLQLTKVRDSCCDFLSKRLDQNNVISVRDLAEGLNCLSLVKNADSYIRKNFDAFSQTKEFLGLSFTFLNNLIRKDELEVSSEEMVYDAVMKWVKTDAKKQKMLPDLLAGVRMTFLSPQFLIKKASKEKLIMDSATCRNLLDEAKHYHLLPEEGASICSFELSERCYAQRTGGGIYLFCCSEANGLTIFKYIDNGKKWSVVLTDKSRSDLRHVLVLGDEIYVFREETFETFNPGTLAWAPKATFPCAYTDFKFVIPWNGKIYWFRNSQNQGMCFDSQQNRWVKYAYRNLHLYSDDELVPCGNKVYVLGSLNRLYYTGWRNVMYDLETQGVSYISSMKNERSAFGSAVLGDALFVCGGICESNRDDRNARGYYRERSADESISRVTEMYTFPQEWRTASSMNKSRKNFSLLAYNEKLYAIGGTTNTADLEVYDPTTNKWTLANCSLGDRYDLIKVVAIFGGKN